MMILVDALHINRGGGFSLLKLLVNALEKEELDVFYLFDERAEKYFQKIPKERKHISKAGLFYRLWFYKRNSKKFEKVFCFANFPPLLKYNERTITYFQNVLLLGKQRNGSFKDRLASFFKKSLLSLTRNNTAIWCVQTENTKQLFSDAFPDQVTKLRVFPFWDDSFYKENINNSKKNRFLYVSDGPPHKNHLLLLQAWEQLHALGYDLPLTLTVNSDNIFVCNEIKKLQDKGIPVVNMGIVKKEQVLRLYKDNDVTIYPSLEESFGLGIIEAVSMGHDLIASDLSYVRDIVQASNYFNPLKSDDIAKAVISYVTSSATLPAKLLVKSRLYDLISEIKN